jgi:hypothetical protein
LFTRHVLLCHLKAQPCLLLLKLSSTKKSDWPQIIHACTCESNEFTDMPPRVEWKCNGMKTRGSRRWWGFV